MARFLLLLGLIISTASASIFLPGQHSSATSLPDSARSSLSEHAFHQTRSINRALQNRRLTNDGRLRHPLAIAIPGNSVAEQVVVGGFGNFISIYNTVITARILLSWFPQAQGIGALQPVYQITDPYLNLFRGIIPPIFGLDLSPILAFVTLNLLQSSAVSLAAEIPQEMKKKYAQKRKGWGMAVMRGQDKLSMRPDQIRGDREKGSEGQGTPRRRQARKANHATNQIKSNQIKSSGGPNKQGIKGTLKQKGKKRGKEHAAAPGRPGTLYRQSSAGKKLSHGTAQLLLAVGHRCRQSRQCFGPQGYEAGVGIVFLHVGICAAFAPPTSSLTRAKFQRYEPQGAIQVFASGNKENTSEPTGGSNPASQLVVSWLMTHLPTLSSSDLQLYSTYLLNDGYHTVDQLNKINSGGKSGRIEDLYFMKKGHRRLLMKKIGLINGLKNSGANRLHDEGNVSSNERSTEMRPTSIDDEFLPEKFPNPQISSNDEEKIDEEIAFLDEDLDVDMEPVAKTDFSSQSMTDFRTPYGGRTTDFYAERRMKLDKQRGPKGGSSFGVRASAMKKTDAKNSRVNATKQEKRQIKIDKPSVQKVARKQSTVSSGRATPNAKTDGVEMDGANIHQDEPNDESAEDESSTIYQNEPGSTIEERLEHPSLMAESSNDESDRFEQYINYDFDERIEEEFTSSDDFAARSLTMNDFRNDSDSSKSSRRLEELRRVFLERMAKSKSNLIDKRKAGDKVGASSQDKGSYSYQDHEHLEDFEVQYLSMNEFKDDSGATDKGSRRIDDLKRELIERRQAREEKQPPDDDFVLDDFKSRYRNLEVAREDWSTADKGQRRVDELKREFARRLKQRRASDSAGAIDDEIVLDDLESRYRALGGSANDRGPPDKGAMRIKAMQADFLIRSKDTSSAGDSEGCDDEELLDDFVMRSNKARGSANAAERSAADSIRAERRLKELREYAEALQAQLSYDEEEYLDDFEARYRSFSSANEDDGGSTVSKKAERRLAKLKIEALRNAASVDEVAHLLQETKTKVDETHLKTERSASKADEAIRIDLLQTPVFEGSLIDSKERKRLNDFQELAMQLAKAANETTPQSSSKSIRPKSNELRRLEELEKHYAQRQATRKAKEERLKEQQKIAQEQLRLRRKTYHSSTVAEAIPTDNFFEERPLATSLSTTLPPTNANASKVTAKRMKGRSSVQATGAEQRRVVDAIDEYVDITRNNVPEREMSRSLSTTMLPTEQAVMAENQLSRGEQDEIGAIRDDGSSSFDITRGILFSDRDNQSLSTTMLPANTRETIRAAVVSRALGALGKRSSKMMARRSDAEDDEYLGSDSKSASNKGNESVAINRTRATPSSSSDDTDDTLDRVQGLSDEEKELIRNLRTRQREVRDYSEKTAPAPKNSREDVEEDEYFDITAQSDSAFTPQDKSDMNSRRPSAEALYQKFQSRSPPRPLPKNREDNRVSDCEESYYDITQSSFPEERRDRSIFSTLEQSEMNTRSPPRNFGGPKWSRLVSSESEGGYFDVTRALFADERPSSSVNTGTRKKLTTGGTFEEEKATLSGNSQPNQDRTDRTAEERPAASINSGTKKEPITTNGPTEGKRTANGSDPTLNVKYKSTEKPGDAAIVDIAKALFAKQRPSQLVNSGTKKDLTTTGTFEESQNARAKLDDFVGDLSPQGAAFSSERPSWMGNTEQSSTKTKSVDEKQRSSPTDDVSDSVDITRQPFSKKIGPEDSVERRGAATTFIQQEQDASLTPEYRYMTEKNFSRDRDSLIGKPSVRRKPNVEDNKYLDSPQFSSDLSPSSERKSSATSYVWSQGLGKGHLDTPKPFEKDLDLVPPNPTSYRSPEKPNRESVRERRSSNARSPNRSRSDAQVFGSRVDMKSSNTSGARFKRSSDIPPEQKRTRDYYDITTNPLSSRERMVQTERRKDLPTPQRGKRNTDGLEFRNESLSSASHEANKRNARDKQLPFGMGKSVAKPIETEPSSSAESSYEEVMQWLLTKLPGLGEENAVSYFNRLLEEGFDSNEMLGHIERDDLEFMSEEHIMSIFDQDNTDVDADNSRR
ncbi:hypothetical protein THAOC_25079 [Thalassiosira oceanica]|uniref:Uncharacterized protein n=1 Tax=Thalassiosira oceanica TaxID=159749 RepID=K0RQ89_THAOC|nr:hypothetical protein THAOC_25079 [Thalassiosira oceanica]|eukprot:EJK55210.1 hypothetical protein THAOC_25079 [Thalassiosira oceanica]